MPSRTSAPPPSAQRSDCCVPGSVAALTADDASGAAVDGRATVTGAGTDAGGLGISGFCVTGTGAEAAVFATREDIAVFGVGAADAARVGAARSASTAAVAAAMRSSTGAVCWTTGALCLNSTCGLAGAIAGAGSAAGCAGATGVGATICAIIGVDWKARTAAIAAPAGRIRRTCAVIVTGKRPPVRFISRQMSKPGRSVKNEGRTDFMNICSFQVIEKNQFFLT